MSLLLEPAAANPQTIYPVLEVIATKRVSGFDQEFYLTDCCFGELMDADYHDLAGMGLAIIGNVMKHIGQHDLSTRDAVRLDLIMVKGATPISCPWPGMPNDRPLPLDYEKLPWDSTMFLGDKGDFKFRMKRWLLMARIESTWVPWLLGKLKVVV